MAPQTGLLPLMYGMGLTHLKVPWRRAETQVRRQSCSSVSDACVSDAVPETDFVFHPLRFGQVHLWMLVCLKLPRWLVGCERALFLG